MTPPRQGDGRRREERAAAGIQDAHHVRCSSPAGTALAPAVGAVGRKKSDDRVCVPPAGCSSAAGIPRWCSGDDVRQVLRAEVDARSRPPPVSRSDKPPGAAVDPQRGAVWPASRLMGGIGRCAARRRCPTAPCRRRWRQRRSSPVRLSVGQSPAKLGRDSDESCCGCRPPGSNAAPPYRQVTPALPERPAAVGSQPGTVLGGKVSPLYVRTPALPLAGRYQSV